MIDGRAKVHVQHVASSNNTEDDADERFEPFHCECIAVDSLLIESFSQTDANSTLDKTKQKQLSETRSTISDGSIECKLR
jgi:hypothetical protein